MRKAKKLMSLLLALIMVFSTMPSSALAAETSFTDVKETDWFYDGVQYAYDHGLMSGTGNSKFSPSLNTTRAMLVTILHRMEKAPVAGESTFTDVEVGSWYANAVAWAASTGIVRGYSSGRFGPMVDITREQMATILYRYATFKECDVSAHNDLSKYVDAANISSWAQDALSWANAMKLVNGIGESRLDPQGVATRAQTATILRRFCENVVDASQKVQEIKSFTVAYDLNYGKKTTYLKDTVEEGKTASEPTIPTRSGYDFSGWYTSASNGKKFDFSSPITSDITLYARWSSISDGDSSSSSGSSSSSPTPTPTVEQILMAELKANGSATRTSGNYSNLTIGSGQILTISGNGEVTLGGLTTNNGTIVVDNTGVKLKLSGVVNNNGTVTNNGTIENKATFNNNSANTLHNNGIFDNYGVLVNGAVADGRIVNSALGTITIRSRGTLTNNLGGSIENAGTITIEQDATYIANGTVSGNPITNQNELSDYSRGEWVQALAQKLGMNLSINAEDIDCYFADSQGSQYVVAIETAQAYGILPAPDIEDLEQDVPQFYPDKPATREFAAYTAVKAMGFDGKSEYDTSTWADLTSIEYPEIAAIAVGFNFLNLEDSEYYYPTKNLTKAEASTIFSAIDEINASTLVSAENVHDNTVYADDIVRESLTAISSYSIKEITTGKYGVYNVSPDTVLLDIHIGDVVILPATDEHITGVALKVEEIDYTDGTEVYNFVGSKPELSEVFTEIDFAGVGTPIIGEVIPAEGVTCEYDASGISDDDSELYPLDIDLGGSYKVPGKLKFTVAKKKVSENLEASGSVEVEIPDVTCIFDAHIGLFDTEVHEFTISVQEKVKFKGELKYTLAESGYELTNSIGNTRWEKGRVELGRIPIAIGATGLSFDLVFFYNVEAKGTASITYTIISTQGYQYKNGASRVIFDFDDSLDFLELKGSARAGIGLAGDICAFELMDIVGYSGEFGIAFNGSFTPHILATDTLFCGDITLYAYATSGLDKETVVGKFLDKVCHYTLEFEHLKNDENNPLKLKLHIENGKRVAECTFGTGAISGYVAALDSRNAIHNARINIYSTGSLGDNLVRTLYSDPTGKFGVNNLHAGTYIVKVSATGYFTYEWTLNVAANETTYVETLLMIDRAGNLNELGAIQGSITDAVSGFPITNSTYKLRKGWNMQSGQVLTEGEFVNSTYSLSYSVGNYTLEVSRNEYMTNWINIAISKDSSTTANVVLTPQNMQSGVMRIVLTWGDMPPDIDSHTFGPTLIDANQEFHVYFGNKDFDNGNVTLDLDIDDIDGNGPETTTIKMLNGNAKYSYYVHDYTNQSETISTALSLSGAKVQVYIGNSVRTFNIPTNKAGTVWHVFDYDASTATITPVNEFTYSGDADTLSR